MLKTLQNEDEIKTAQEIFESVLKKITDEKIPVIIGYKGGNVEAEVSYSKKYNLWFYVGDILKGINRKTRYWNVFGINKPKENSTVSIVVEINPPLRGIYRIVGGVFAKDDKGNIFLLHRGRIGGGRKGIGLKAFYEHYGGEKRVLQEDDKPIALIGCITSSDFPEKLKKFVENVAKIKKMIRQRSSNSEFCL